MGFGLWLVCLMKSFKLGVILANARDIKLSGLLLSSGMKNNVVLIL